MLALALIPLILLFSTTLVIYKRLSLSGVLFQIRLAYLYSVLAVGLYGVVITEILSYYSLITFKAILIGWTVPAIVVSLIWARTPNALSDMQTLVSTLLSLFRKHWILWVGIAFLLVSFLIALTYPTNNYDSLTYHMARVAHWEQNQSIAHYQTHVVRQLIFPPLAEWVILHIKILTGSDVYANSIQLFFFAGCMVNGSLICRELGGNFRQQLLSILFICMIPMAVIQSNTTQNDIVVAFFVTAFVYFSIRSLKKPALATYIIAGVSLGLAWLSKGTAYLFTFLFCAWLAIILIRNFSMPVKFLIREGLKLAIIPFIALLINSGHYYRNIFLTDSPLGNASSMTGNEGHEFKPLMLVTIKNFMNHLPVTKSMKEKLTRKSEKWGLDINDEKYNYNTLDWMMEGFSVNEDYAQNFIHAILILVLGILFFFRRSLYQNPLSYYVLYVMILIITALLFCLSLKWQPWSNRLETGLFMLFSIFLAMEAGKLNKWLQLTCILPMLGFAIAALFWSVQHPLLPYSQSVYSKGYNSFIYDEKELKARSYLDSTQYKNIGIHIGADSKDYIYYKLLATSPHGKRTIKHVFVNNQSTRYLDDFSPDAILSVNDTSDKLVLNGKSYYFKKAFGPALALYAAQ